MSENQQYLPLRNRMIALLDAATVSRNVSTIEEILDFWSEWFRKASPETVSAMLDVIIHPPERERSSYLAGWSWDDEAGDCFGAWGKSHPEEWEKLLQVMIKSRGSRYIAISSMTEVGASTLSSQFPLLEELVKNVNELPNDEIILLVDTLGSFGYSNKQDAMKLLLRLRRQVPSNRIEIHQEIDEVLQELK